MDADFIVGDLYDFICEDLLANNDLDGRIDTSIDTFTLEACWLRLFLCALYYASDLLWYLLSVYVVYNQTEVVEETKAS